MPPGIWRLSKQHRAVFIEFIIVSLVELFVLWILFISFSILVFVLDHTAVPIRIGGTLLSLFPSRAAFVWLLIALFRV